MIRAASKRREHDDADEADAMSDEDKMQNFMFKMNMFLFASTIVAIKAGMCDQQVYIYMQCNISWKFNYLYRVYICFMFLSFRLERAYTLSMYNQRLQLLTSVAEREIGGAKPEQ